MTSNLPPLKVLLPAAIAVLLTSAGLGLARDPVSFAKPFGTVFTTDQEVLVERHIGGKNFLSGLTIGVLTYQENFAGVSTYLMCYPVIGIIDPWAGWMMRGTLWRMTLFILG